jgi:hypothetical protein
MRPYAAERNTASRNSTPISVADRQATRQVRSVRASSKVSATWDVGRAHQREAGAE